jgi:hypothetical protein
MEGEERVDGRWVMVRVRRKRFREWVHEHGEAEGSLTDSVGGSSPTEDEEEEEEEEAGEGEEVQEGCEEAEEEEEEEEEEEDGEDRS